MQSWTCPQCKRRIPPAMDTCRCGFSRMVSYGGSERSYAWVGWLAACCALIGVGALQMARGGPEPMKLAWQFRSMATTPQAPHAAQGPQMIVIEKGGEATAPPAGVSFAPAMETIVTPAIATPTPPPPPALAVAALLRWERWRSSDRRSVYRRDLGTIAARADRIDDNFRRSRLLSSTQRRIQAAFRMAAPPVPAPAPLSPDGRNGLERSFREVHRWRGARAGGSEHDLKGLPHVGS